MIFSWIIIAIALFFVYKQYKKYDGKPIKYFISALLLAISVIFISPEPDPISFGLYALLHNSTYSAMLNPSVLASVLWNYEIWSCVIGIILLLISGWILGRNWKKQLDKINPGKYWLAIGLGFLIIIIISFLDIQGLIFFTDLGRNYLSGDFPHSYWIAFRNTAYILMGLVAICYGFFVRKDKSEIVAVFLTPFILFWTGMNDVFFFVLRKVPIPNSLPWLDNSPIISFISKTLGYESVTNVSLLFSVFVGIIAIILMTKFMKDKI